MFRTELSCSPSKIKISKSSKIISVGSCFAENILAKLADAKLAVQINPMGIAYNPISILNLLDPDFVFNSEHTVSIGDMVGTLDCHSKVCAHSSQTIEGELQNLKSALKEAIKTTDILVLTFGTAFVYTFKQTGKIICNCHKQASNLFTKNLLSPLHISEHFAAISSKLLAINPKLKFILTVSPVRHIKESLVGNTRSKAILHESIRLITEKSSADTTSYFPAFEIMIDDLRDYRFYKEDMIHPNVTALSYIFDKFAEVHLDDDLLIWIEKWKTIKKRLLHRPFYPNSDQHQSFLLKLKSELTLLSKQFDLTIELEEVHKQLIDSQ